MPITPMKASTITDAARMAITSMSVMLAKTVVSSAHPVSVPHMNISPCAKLISFSTP